MELMFKARQRLWQDVLAAILRFVIEQSAMAPSGTLAGRAVVKRNDWGEQVVDFGDLVTHIDVDFPDLLEKDVAAKVNAIIAAGTLNGQEPAGLDLKTITKMLLVALGEDDVDQLIDEQFPEGWEKARAENAAQGGARSPEDDDLDDDDETPERETRVFEDLRGAVTRLAEALRDARDADA